MFDDEISGTVAQPTCHVKLTITEVRVRHLIAVMSQASQVRTGLEPKPTSTEGSVPVPPVSSATLGKSLNLCEPQFPHLQNGNNSLLPESLRAFVKYLARS